MSKKGRKRKLGVEDKEIVEWETNRILPEDLRDEMETMWEIPQIYHFLQLTKDAFHITHLSMYEVERMLLMPKASRQLAHIMTHLLSSASTSKCKLQKVPPMPYDFWTNILMYKLKSWFKMYQTKHHDSIKVFDTLGIEPEFWRIFPDASAIEGKDFQDFNFRQRVWLLKTVCDTVMHSRKTIQDEISRQPSENQFETVLGIDRYGARYIYFPQFLNSDLRVYRHCIDNKILSTVKSPNKEKTPKVAVVIKEEPRALPRVNSKRKRRKSRWSSGSLPPKLKKKEKKKLLTSINQSLIDSNSNSRDAHCSRSSRSSSKASELSTDSLAKSSSETNSSENPETIVNELKKVLDDVEADIEEDDNLEDSKNSDVTAAEVSLKSATALSPKSENPSVTENTLVIKDDLSKSSKTDDEKLEEMSSLNATKVVETSKMTDLQGTKDVNISKSDDEKLSESKICDTKDKDECVDNAASKADCTNEEKDIKTEDKSFESLGDEEASNSNTHTKMVSDVNPEVEKKEEESMLDICESEGLCPIDIRDNLCRISSESEEEYPNLNNDFRQVEDLNELITELSVSNFQLVADSLDSLKDLTEHIASDRTVPGLDIEDENYVIPTCEQKLLKRMKVLLAALENVKSSLRESTKKARDKLQREWNNFENKLANEDQEGEPSGTDRWVVNSQGCPFPATLAALSNSSSSGTRDSEADKNTESASADSTKAQTKSSQKAGDSTEGLEIKTEKDSEEEEEGCEKKEGCGKGKTKRGDDKKKASEKKEESKRTTRVLRTRGCNTSYTEQLFSDDESEEDQLDGWADIEAVYAAASTSAGTSAPNSSAKGQSSGHESSDEEEDSDKDWILPSSRKRNRKRASASRRLKTFQNKLQSINADQDVNQKTQPSQPISTPTKLVPHTKQSPVKYTPKPTPKPSPSKTPEKAPSTPSSTNASPPVPSSEFLPIKTEFQDPNLHSVLDIKDEGPIYDSTSGQISCAQPNYVVVSTAPAPVANYYVMQQNPPVTAVVQQSQFMQPTAFVPQMMPQVVTKTVNQKSRTVRVGHKGIKLEEEKTVSAGGYYVQQGPAGNYVVQNPSGLIAAGPGQAYIATTTPQLVYQQQAPTQLIAGAQQQLMQPAQNYVQYVAAPQQPAVPQPPIAQPRIINTMTLSPARQINYRMRAPNPAQGFNGNRMPMTARLHSNGAVIRSAPVPSNFRPGMRPMRPPTPNRRQQPPQQAPRLQSPNKSANASTNTPKTTSLIVLSDSDDEIEMIITEKPSTAISANRTPVKAKQPAPQPQQSSPLSSPQKSVLPPELLQRVNEGGISISPVKPNVSSSQTQLVVVVNETGSHYALALPNGSKLILTPEQVAQIRASNGGKLQL